jgi:proteic killer suppression protein
LPLSFTHEVKTEAAEPRVRVAYRTRKLERWYTGSKEAQRALGPIVARRYVIRINIIRAAKNLEELRGLPGLRFHELKGDRTGRYSITLDGFYRLIVTIEGESVTVEEVSKHYGD